MKRGDPQNSTSARCNQFRNLPNPHSAVRIRQIAAIQSLLPLLHQNLSHPSVAHAQDVDAVSRCPSHLATVEVIYRRYAISLSFDCLNTYVNLYDFLELSPSLNSLIEFFRSLRNVERGGRECFLVRFFVTIDKYPTTNGKWILYV